MGSSRRINVFGVTGSIGRSAADVIAAHAERFDVQVVSAHRDAEGLAAAAQRLGAQVAVIADESHGAALEEALSGSGIEVRVGGEALLEAARTEVDVTLGAIVGMAGLSVIWEAIQYSQYLAIANKEPLVAAGALVMAHARAHNCTILPVDSEHNAVMQVFDEAQRDTIRRVILTASGGPFLEWSLEEMRAATPDQAVAHPNWDMGAKISVDSATMMNKALEVIEAHILFDLPPEMIDVVVHPQSLVHSFVEYNDGSLLSQMGASDMRTPLSNILFYPERLETPGDRLDFSGGLTLDFSPADHAQFPALKLAYECIEKGAHACLAMNAANEVAVAAFLGGEIGFLDIVSIAQDIVNAAQKKSLSSLVDALSYDADIRAQTQALIQTRNHKVA